MVRTDRLLRPAFLGVFPADRLPTTHRSGTGLIVNTDPSDRPGTHWVAMYWDNEGRAEFFDSYGQTPQSYHPSWGGLFGTRVPLQYTEFSKSPDNREEEGFDPRLKTPSNLQVVGPSKSGKTHWVRRLIQERQEMFRQPLSRVVYCYGEWQPMFDTFPEEVEWVKGMPEDFYEKFEGQPGLLVLDDLMAECSNNDAVEKLFTHKDPVKMLKDIERTRNWLMWHDHSGLGNRGMMLFFVIEEPHLYMMGLSGSSDADQMLFIPTRRECLQSFSQPVESKDGIAIQDKMRFMNGDNPSVEYEDGTQKGGHRGCAGCDGDIRMAGQYDYMAYRQYKTLEEKCQLVMAGIE
ncbi:hypothetical protein QZH41_005383, partial [Actinostola sp. cb2023]